MPQRVGQSLRDDPVRGDLDRRRQHRQVVDLDLDLDVTPGGLGDGVRPAARSAPTRPSSSSAAGVRLREIRRTSASSVSTSLCACVSNVTAGAPSPRAAARLAAATPSARPARAGTQPIVQFTPEATALLLAGDHQLLAGRPEIGGQRDLVGRGGGQVGDVAEQRPVPTAEPPLASSQPDRQPADLTPAVHQRQVDDWRPGAGPWPPPAASARRE